MDKRNVAFNASIHHHSMISFATPLKIKSFRNTKAENRNNTYILPQTCFQVLFRRFKVSAQCLSMIVWKLQDKINDANLTSQYNSITELVRSLLSIPGAIVPKLQTFLLSGTRFWKVLGKYRKFQIFSEVLRFLKITSNNIQSGRPIMTLGWYMS